MPGHALQLPLGIEMPQTATLDAFVGTTNAPVCAAVAAIVAGHGQRLYLHGPRATGKTHLLQAACRAISDAGQRCAYVPLRHMAAQAHALLPGMQMLDCVCLDDVGAIAGDREAEIALVGLIDGLRARNGRLLVGDRFPVTALPLKLADLASRLSGCATHKLVELDDADKKQLLVSGAAQRGLQLPDATARYLLRRVARDVPSLMAALARLDAASLAAQRRLTIPFVKQVLA